MFDTLDWNALHLMSPATQDDADKICEIYDASMRVIDALVVREIALLKNGQIEDALALTEDKQKHAIDYARATDLMRRNLIAITRLSPNRLAQSTAAQHALMDKLKESATMIAMIRTLSETMLRGVVQDVGATTTLTTYGDNGKTLRQSGYLGTQAVIVSTHL